MQTTVTEILKRSGLRDTKPRRLILQALAAASRPLSHKQILAKVKAARGAVDLVTIYRVLKAFEDLGVVHRSAGTGGVVLCSLPGDRGHHVMLNCQSCGRVEERADGGICKEENRLARSAGFTPKVHLSQISGICSSCH